MREATVWAHLAWWCMAAKMYDRRRGVRRWDGEVISEKSLCANAVGISIDEVLALFQAWQAEGWDTVALWKEGE